MGFGLFSGDMQTPPEVSYLDNTKPQRVSLYKGVHMQYNFYFTFMGKGSMVKISFHQSHESYQQKFNLPSVDLPPKFQMITDLEYGGFRK